MREHTVRSTHVSWVRRHRAPVRRGLLPVDHDEP